MLTPVSVARQCLTAEAVRALDEAVAVARRRNHAQTTSVHALSAILTFPASILRDACTRVRSSSYSCRLQFRALELCFTSALDRLPSSQPLDEPPISNSFMAAIKRSQANQRRHPEAFQFHLQQAHVQQSSSSLSCVKVELQQLILSVLDDPSVSRVFAEAGFSSCDLKLAILRPRVSPPLFSRYSRSRRPPLFLCNLPGSDAEFGGRNFSFPFLGFSEKDDNCRRIAEVLVRNKERNPLLVGVSAIEAVRNFGEVLESGKGGGTGGGVLPSEVCGLRFVSIDKEILGSSERFLGVKFEELGQVLESSCGGGVVVSFGDLKVFVNDGLEDVVRYVVVELSRLLQLHTGKLWLIGATESSDMYSKCLIKFPSIEEWDLHLLPITVTTSMEGGFHSRPHSLTESFVPFGGFFPTTSDLRDPFSTTYLPTSRCDLCNEKYEQERSLVVKGGCTLSVADQYQASLPSWLQTSELKTNGLDIEKAKDDGTVLNAKVTGLKKKWNDICQRLNHCQHRPQMFTGNMGFPFAGDKVEKTDNNSSCSTNAIPVHSDKSVLPSMSVGLKNNPALNQNASGEVSAGKDENLVSELLVKPSKSEWLLTEGLQFPPCPLESTIAKDQESPCPASVTTDLGLGTLYATSKKPKRPTFSAHRERFHDFTDCLPSLVDSGNPNLSNPSAQSSSFSGSDLSSQFDPKDFKLLWRSLTGKVDRQTEAINVVSQTIARCRSGNGRRRGASLKRDIWFRFVGPDRVAKRKIALALAEIIYGSQENLIWVDLSSQDGFMHENTIFGGQDINGYDEKFRGKMVVDYIAEEISKKPLSLVFLENIDKADILLQSSLSQAIKTGRFSDSSRREISINNTIFVATSETLKDDQTSPFEKVHVNFSEDTIVRAEILEMQILTGCISEKKIVFSNSNVLVTSRKGTCATGSVNKRKHIVSSDVKERHEMIEWARRAHKTTKYLDLNLPVEELEGNDTDSGSSDSDSVYQDSDPWFKDFFNQMDETVIFKPFDFAALADSVLLKISAIFKSTIGSEGLLEIDSKVIEQILAAAWLSDRKGAVEDWVVHVLGRSFTEARQRYALASRPVLKLVSCEGFYLKERADAVYLPSRIILN